MTYPLGGSGSTVATELVDPVAVIELTSPTYTWAGLFGTHSRTVAIELVDPVAIVEADTRTWVALTGGGAERNPTFPQLEQDLTTWPTAL